MIFQLRANDCDSILNVKYSTHAATLGVRKEVVSSGNGKMGERYFSSHLTYSRQRHSVLSIQCEHSS